VYLSKKEDIQRIIDKVSIYPDYIHLDLVDSTFNESAGEVDISKGHEARKSWPGTKTMTHIMSAYPSKWVDKVADFSDYIIIHTDIDEPIRDVIKKIRALNKKVGISLISGGGIEQVRDYLSEVDLFQILGISSPGKSGQHMETEALEEFEELKDIRKKGKYKYELCFDGGIKLGNVNKIDAKYVVSGSTVLNSEKAVETMFALKTNSRYYYGHENDLSDFIKKSVREIVDEDIHIKSGTIVGSFSKTQGLKGIGDIDIVLILDKLNKTKYNQVLERFQELGRIIKADYDFDYIINPTLGPLKFNRKNMVVFHLMLYDVDKHKQHCLRSPFTCYDWQKSEHCFGLPMSHYYSVLNLQPNHFFSSRRSIKGYMKDLDSGSISYRRYDFKKGAREVMETKKMNKKDMFEFSYHIMKFCMLNFLKLYHRKNLDLEFHEIAEQYFELFPNGKDRFMEHLEKIRKMKQLNSFRK